MEPWVLVMSLMVGDRSELHAIAQRSERSCWQWVALAQKSGREWIGICISIEQFRRDFPGVELEHDS